MTQQSILHLVVNWKVFTINIVLKRLNAVHRSSWFWHTGLSYMHHVLKSTVFTTKGTYPNSGPRKSYHSTTNVADCEKQATVVGLC